MSADPPEPPEPRSRRRLLIALGIGTLVAAVAGALVVALLVRVFEHKQEARSPFFRVVELDEHTTDPTVWAQNFPHHHDGYARTVDQVRTRHGGSEAFQKLDEFPVWRRIFAGYPFGVDYREERGHAYSLTDQLETERVTKFKQPGSCLHCHASVIPAYMQAGLAAGAPAGEAHREEQIRKGFEAMCAMPFAEAAKQVSHPVSCIDCHAHRRSEMDDEHRDVSGYSWSSPACYSCHPNGSDR